MIATSEQKIRHLLPEEVKKVFMNIKLIPLELSLASKSLAKTTVHQFPPILF